MRVRGAVLEGAPEGGPTGRGGGEGEGAERRHHRDPCTPTGIRLLFWGPPPRDSAPMPCCGRGAVRRGGAEIHIR